MTGFIFVSLIIFACCAVIGMIFPFLLAAKARTFPLAVLAFAIAAWVVVVLGYAAWRLR